MKKSSLAIAMALATNAAVAADLPSQKGPPVYVPPPPPPMWTGFYAGLNAGYGFAGTSNAWSQGYASVAPYSLGGPGARNPIMGGAGLGLANTGLSSVNQNGFIGGGQIGYNYQWGPNFLIGIEADIQGTGIRGSSSFIGAGLDSAVNAGGPSYSRLSVGSTTINTGVDWLGTVRGRVGYLFTPTLLIFGTGGLSYGGVYANATTWANGTISYANFNGAGPGNPPPAGVAASQSFFGDGRQSNTLVGWNAGGGFEWMIMPNWSIKAEALYYDLGSMNLSTTAIAPPVPGQGQGPNQAIPAGIILGNTRIHYNGVIARAGINYHFNFGSAPVVAKF